MNEGTDNVELRILYLVAKAAMEHPFFAVWGLGMASGSLVTWAYMTTAAEKKGPGVVAGTVVDVEIPRENLQDMLEDDTVELHWHFPLISVKVKSAKQVKPLELPVVEVVQDKP